MKKKIFLFVLFVIVFGVVVALSVSPEFCYFWQDTPVLSQIYAWVDKYFKPFAIAVTKSEQRFIYIAIIGGLVISLISFFFLSVKKAEPKETCRNVSVTPVIKNTESSTIIVVEEKGE